MHACLGKNYHIVQRGDWGGGKVQHEGFKSPSGFVQDSGRGVWGGRGLGEGEDSSSWPGSWDADKQAGVLSLLILSCPPAEISQAVGVGPFILSHVVYLSCLSLVPAHGH